MSEDWPDFKHVDWDDLYPRLLAYAEGRLRRIRSIGSAPRGLLASDFVQQAIKEAMTGERSWDPHRTLFKNLEQIISSEISNVATSYENKNTESVNDNVVAIRDHQKSPEQAVIDKLGSERILDYIGSVDREARQVAELILYQDVTESLRISTALQISVREVENIKKPLRRLCTNYQQQYGNWTVLPKSSAAPSDEAVQK